MRHSVFILVASFLLGTGMSMWLPAQTPRQPSDFVHSPALDGNADRLSQRSASTPSVVTSPTAAPAALMKAKLDRSQNVLEGLLRKDFKRVAQGAREMKRISEAAEWPRARDTVYEHFSAEFRRQCNHLESLAGSENHEGATFVYLQMTTTCIHCHDYVRDSLRVAQLKSRDNVSLIPAQWPEPAAVEKSHQQLRQPANDLRHDRPRPSSAARPAARLAPTGR
ncbi:MAG: hypothetical protein WBD20_08295 [Pirellulaceae bacterium]